jgi:hypothetical protein
MVTDKKGERIVTGNESLMVIQQDRSDTAARSHFYFNPVERSPTIARGYVYPAAALPETKRA